MEYLTADEAATYLKITKKAIYNRVYRKQIPFTRIGRTLRFPKGELDRLLKARTQQPLD